MHETSARFAIGQVIHHKLFDYRGVVVDVDADFQGSEEWYEQVALSRPPRDRPWYHVLVHGTDRFTYVAERNLEPDPDPRPVDHPAVEAFFTRFDGRVYTRDEAVN